MSKYKFNSAQKWAIWKTLGPNCRWCNEPVKYHHAQIDHILPESLEDDKKKLDRLIKIYSLKTDFDLNSFFNWIPIHSGCNQSKGADIFDAAPFIGQLLQRVAAKVPEIVIVHDEMAKEPKAGKVLAALERSILDELVTEEQVNEILISAKNSMTPYLGLTASTIQHNFFILPKEEGWKLVRSKDDYDEVSKDGKFGITSNADVPDLSWLCSNCNHFGPWDGNRCLTCGTLSYPD
jgi:hypothetical protein